MATETIHRGDSWTVTATYTGGDLTGWSWGITVKKKLNDTDAKAVLSYGMVAASGGEISAAAFSTTFAAATMAAIAPGTYYYDVQIKNAAGVVSSSDVVTLVITQDSTIRSS
jgi:hypothetical protein